MSKNKDQAVEGVRTRRFYADNPAYKLEPLKPEPDELEDIDNWPFIKFFGNINYCTTFVECAAAADSILQYVESTNGWIPLGFDMEWPFNFQTGPEKTALIQICPDKRMCHLLHVAELEKLPSVLIKLLSHPRVKLCGVNIKNDIHKLGRDFPKVKTDVMLSNCCDSRWQANTVTFSKPWSMERLTNEFLKMRLDKNPKIRRCKWNIIPLSEDQQMYAATDAYVSLVLHQHLNSLIRKQPRTEKK